MSINDLIDDILRREGGFVDHKNDRGGATKFGITQDTLTQWRGEPVSVEDVRRLEFDEAAEIYAARYVTQPKFDQIPYDSVTALVVDCGVNHGVSRATRWLQKAADVNTDGMVGPVTLSAVKECDPGDLYRAILADRSSFYGRIITNDPSQAAFAAGWANRLSEFIEETP